MPSPVFAVGLKRRVAKMSDVQLHDGKMLFLQSFPQTRETHTHTPYVAILAALHFHIWRCDASPLWTHFCSLYTIKYCHRVHISALNNNMKKMKEIKQQINFLFVYISWQIAASHRDALFFLNFL